MAWHLNDAPAPVNEAGYLVVGDFQYPPSAPAADLEALGLVWVEPEEAVPTLSQRLAQLGDLRWQQAQHMTYGGVTTQADGAIAVVNATLTLRARRGVPASVEQSWKLADGEFRQWDEGDIEAFGYAVADHIQACFDREAALTLALTEAADPSSIDITTGWP